MKILKFDFSVRGREYMKTCRYCGKLGPDDSTSCPECGTAFDLPTGQPDPPSSGRRPPRPDAASIVLREYPNEAAAQRAIDALRAARIEGYIATVNSMSESCSMFMELR